MILCYLQYLVHYIQLVIHTHVEEWLIVFVQKFIARIYFLSFQYYCYDAIHLFSLLFLSPVFIHCQLMYELGKFCMDECECHTTKLRFILWLWDVIFMTLFSRYRQKKLNSKFPVNSDVAFEGFARFTILHLLHMPLCCLFFMSI